MLDPSDDEAPRGKVDTVAVLYIAFGIPSIVGFLVLLFSAVKAWNIPA